MKYRGYLGSWRTHQVKDRRGQLRPGEFVTCQQEGCPEDHFISSFKGSRPAENDMDGLLDSDGKVGK